MTTFLTLIPTPSFNDYDQNYSFSARHGFTPDLRLCTPSHICRISGVARKWLKDYLPETEELKVSKKFLLHGKKTSGNEKTSWVHPKEIRFLQVEFWKRHCVEVYENYMASCLEMNSLDRLSQLSFKTKFSYPSQEDFNSLNDYFLLQPKDRDQIEYYLKTFPEVTEGIAQAKKFWLGQLDAEEKASVQGTYSKEIEQFRQLLWRRHVQLKPRKKFEWSPEQPKGSCLGLVAGIVMFLATKILITTAIIGSMWYLLIPAAFLFLGVLLIINSFPENKGPKQELSQFEKIEVNPVRELDLGGDELYHQLQQGHKADRAKIKQKNHHKIKLLETQQDLLTIHLAKR